MCGGGGVRNRVGGGGSTIDCRCGVGVHNRLQVCGEGGGGGDPQQTTGMCVCGGGGVHNTLHYVCVCWGGPQHTTGVCVGRSITDHRCVGGEGSATDYRWGWGGPQQTTCVCVCVYWGGEIHNRLQVCVCVWDPQQTAGVGGGGGSTTGVCVCVGGDPQQVCVYGGGGIHNRLQVWVGGSTSDSRDSQGGCRFPLRMGCGRRRAHPGFLLEWDVEGGGRTLVSS